MPSRVKRRMQLLSDPLDVMQPLVRQYAKTYSSGEIPINREKYLVTDGAINRKKRMGRERETGAAGIPSWR